MITTKPKKVDYPLDGYQIICPVCESECVEPLGNRSQDGWECCRCGVKFNTDYEGVE